VKYKIKRTKKRENSKGMQVERRKESILRRKANKKTQRIKIRKRYRRRSEEVEAERTKKSEIYTKEIKGYGELDICTLHCLTVSCITKLVLLAHICHHLYCCGIL
jgi:hypothetical protein